MEALRTILALVLPWVAGAAVVLAITRDRRPVGLAVALGYGYFVGMLALVLGVLALDSAGYALTFAAGAAVPGAMLVAGLIAGWIGASSPPEGEIEPTLSAARRVAFHALLAWLALRTIGLGVEVVLNPLYVWDAWAAWAPKARVWFETSALTPFVDSPAWVHQRPVEAYTLESHAYPPAVPIVQMWMAMALGRWDESTINLPWLAAYVAVGLGTYGQLRAWGASALAALVLTYMLLSLPLLNTHVAWAGIADLWVAAVFGLAAMAALRWARDRDRSQAVLAALLAGGLVLFKLPGAVWALMLLPPLAVAVARRRTLATGTAAAAAAAAGLIGLVVLFPDLAPVDRLTDRLSASVTAPRWGALAAFGNNFYVLSSWHLLWYALPAIMLFALPRLRHSRIHLAATLLLLEAALFLVGVYVFTERAEWAMDYTQLNRAVLHASAFVVFYIGMLWSDGTTDREHQTQIEP